MAKAHWLMGAMGGRAESDSRRAEAMLPVTDTFEVPIADIDPDPDQPRKEISQAENLELAASLSRHGLIHAVVVRRAGDRWMLVAGHRRLLAAQTLGWVKIAARVDRREMDELRCFELQLAENIQRSDLGPVDVAEGYKRMKSELGLSSKQLAELLGISEGKICRALRLLDLPEDVQEGIKAGQVTPSEALDKAPRKRPRKAAPKVKKTWSCKPLKGLTVRVESKVGLEPEVIAQGLRAALESLQAGKKAA